MLSKEQKDEDFALLSAGCATQQAIIRVNVVGNKK